MNGERGMMKERETRKKKKHTRKNQMNALIKGQRYLKNVKSILKNDLNGEEETPREKKMMTRIDLKMKSSKELRELRSLIRKELDFRADIGQELEDGGIKEWVSAAEYSARIQKEKEKNKRNKREDEYIRRIYDV